MPEGAAFGEFWLPPIWTPEWGIHWDMLANYVLVTLYLTVFCRVPLQSIIDGIFLKAKRTINSIQFVLPLGPLGQFRVDFSEYAWDDVFLDATRDLLKRKIAAKKSDAEEIKLEYQTKISDAKNPEERMQKLKEARGKLKELTHDLVNELRMESPKLWKSAVVRYGGEIRAKAVLTEEAKAEVEERKLREGDKQPSLTKKVELMNGSRKDG